MLRNRKRVWIGIVLGAALCVGVAVTLMSGDGHEADTPQVVQQEDQADYEARHRGAVESRGERPDTSRLREGAERVEDAAAARSVAQDALARVEADWGTKTYKGTRKDGTSWEKVHRWFGEKLPLTAPAARAA